jgi:hypothetical protein
VEFADTTFTRYREQGPTIAAATSAGSSDQRTAAAGNPRYATGAGEEHARRNQTFSKTQTPGQHRAIDASRAGPNSGARSPAPCGGGAFCGGFTASLGSGGDRFASFHAGGNRRISGRIAASDSRTERPSARGTTARSRSGAFRDSSVGALSGFFWIAASIEWGGDSNAEIDNRTLTLLVNRRFIKEA